MARTTRSASTRSAHHRKNAAPSIARARSVSMEDDSSSSEEDEEKENDENIHFGMVGGDLKPAARPTAEKHRRVSSSSGSGTAWDPMDLDDDDSQSRDDGGTKTIDEEEEDDELYSDVGSESSDSDFSDLSFGSDSELSFDESSSTDKEDYLLDAELDAAGNDADDDSLSDNASLQSFLNYAEQTISHPLPPSSDASLPPSSDASLLPSNDASHSSSILKAAKSILRATKVAIKSVFYTKNLSLDNDDDDSVVSVTSVESFLMYGADNVHLSSFKGLSLEQIDEVPATLCPESILGQQLDLITPDGPMRVAEADFASGKKCRFEYIYKHPHGSDKLIYTLSKKDALRYAGKSNLQLPHPPEAVALVLAIGYSHDEYTAAYEHGDGKFQVYNPNGENTTVAMRVNIHGPVGDDDLIAMADNNPRLEKLVKSQQKGREAYRTLKAAVVAGQTNITVSCYDFQLKPHDASDASNPFVNGIVRGKEKRWNDVVGLRDQKGTFHKFRVDILGRVGDDVLVMGDSANTLWRIIGPSRKVVGEVFKQLKTDAKVGLADRKTTRKCGNFRMRMHDPSITDFHLGIVGGKEKMVKYFKDLEADD